MSLKKIIANTLLGGSLLVAPSVQGQFGTNEKWIYRNPSEHKPLFNLEIDVLKKTVEKNELSPVKMGTNFGSRKEYTPFCIAQQAEDQSILLLMGCKETIFISFEEKYQELTSKNIPFGMLKEIANIDMDITQMYIVSPKEVSLVQNLEAILNLDKNGWSLEELADFEDSRAAQLGQIVVENFISWGDNLLGIPLSEIVEKGIMPLNDKLEKNDLNKTKNMIDKNYVVTKLAKKYPKNFGNKIEFGRIINLTFENLSEETKPCHLVIELGIKDQGMNRYKLDEKLVYSFMVNSFDKINPDRKFQIPLGAIEQKGDGFYEIKKDNSTKKIINTTNNLADYALFFHGEIEDYSAKDIKKLTKDGKWTGIYQIRDDPKLRFKSEIRPFKGAYKLKGSFYFLADKEFLKKEGSKIGFGLRPDTGIFRDEDSVIWKMLEITNEKGIYGARVECKNEITVKQYSTREHKLAGLVPDVRVDTQKTKMRSKGLTKILVGQ